MPMFMFISTICVLFILLLTIHSSYYAIQPDTRLLEGYYRCDDYSDSHLGKEYDDYYKYYYTSGDDYKFENDEKYEKIRSEDCEKVKLYFTAFTKSSERLKGYDFDENLVDENDYAIIYDYSEDGYYRYHIYFYETSLHILYVTDANYVLPVDSDEN